MMLRTRRTKIILLGQLMIAATLSAQLHYNVVNEEAVKQRLTLYKGDDTKREENLLQLFRQSGCLPENLSEQPVPKRKQPNIICVLPGTTQETIVVGAHFDHVSDGDGIIDNWSGAALLPSLVASLTNIPHKHTFIFVGFTGEEKGLLGSTYYVQQLSSDQVARIEAMVNMDTLGLSPTKVWISQSDPRLVNALGAVAHRLNLPVDGINVDGFGESDEESFIAKKVCSVMVHSITPQTTYVLHRPDDNPAAMQFQDYYDTYRLMAAYLAVLDDFLVADGHVCTAKPVEAFTERRRRIRIQTRH